MLRRRSGARLREAHRRALGRGPRRLPARQFSGRAGANGTTVIATPCARSGTAAAACSADSPSASPVRSDLFRRNGRKPTASINFVAAHDGFTLRDTVSYNERHNEANLEDNRDGHSNNHSWNCGVEGPTDDAAHHRAAPPPGAQHADDAVLLAGRADVAGRRRAVSHAERQQQRVLPGQRNQLGGLGRPQGRRFAAAVRARAVGAAPRARPELRRDTFLKGALQASHSRDICWWHPAGHEMADQEWNNPDLRCLGVGLGGTASSPDLLLLLNPTEAECEFQLPAFSAAATGTWCSIPRIRSACCPASGCPRAR